jgi:hypothetical protein
VSGLESITTGLDPHDFSLNGMLELNRFREQHEPRFLVGFEEFLPGLRVAVFRVADERMPDPVEVPADLMEPPGRGRDADKRERPAGLDPLIVGSRGLRLRRTRRDRFSSPAVP